MPEAAGTSGGWRGMNGAQHRLALMFLAGFLLILAAITIADAESMLTDLAADGVHLRADLVWSWEVTSVIAWMCLCPLLWIGVARLRPPRFARWQVAMAGVIGCLAASACHVAMMVALRKLYYAAVGAGPYHFFGVLPQRLLYEFRKDIATYLQFVALAALAQWAIARAATPAVAPSATPMLPVPDGAVTHSVPLDEIESVTAAANYVEIAWGDRRLLHRATLAALEEQLGDGFVRIHRSRLVRWAAVRRIEADKSGDFTVELASGAQLRGSRRYRDRLHPSA